MPVLASASEGWKTDALRTVGVFYLVGRLRDGASVAAAEAEISAWIFSVFALLALLLSTVGLGGLVALDVTSRRHEFAIRLALGAGARAIVRGVLATALARAAAGIAIGVGLMLGASRGLEALLFGVTASDWPTYVIVLAVVGVVTLVATYLPARHAASADPVALLWSE